MDLTFSDKTRETCTWKTLCVRIATQRRDSTQRSLRTDSSRHLQDGPNYQCFHGSHMHERQSLRLEGESGPESVPCQSLNDCGRRHTDRRTFESERGRHCPRHYTDREQEVKVPCCARHHDGVDIVQVPRGRSARAHRHELDFRKTLFDASHGDNWQYHSRYQRTDSTD